MQTTDPFGRAIRDHYLGERTGPLVDRDGDETREHAIEEWYFGGNAEVTRHRCHGYVRPRGLHHRFRRRRR